MNLWEDKIRKISPYTPGEQPPIKDIIKLNTNESPYPPSPATIKALKDFDYSALRLYPSFKCDSLKEALIYNYGFKKTQYFLGNGSDEVIALCFMAFFNSQKPILFPDITYSFYDVWCNLYNIPFSKIPLNDSFEINKEDYYKENGGIIIANPNAPTGIYMPLDQIEEIIKANRDVIVIIDEAYIDFGGSSAMSLVDKYDNLVIVQTFSKSRALAGIRVGYAIANEELITALETIKNSFNSYTLNSLSQAVATASALDKSYFNTCLEQIIEARSWTTLELSKLGFKTLDSSANFIFTTNPLINTKELFDYLNSKKIIVRYFDKPRINNYLRITIGTMEQMQLLIKAISEFVDKLL